MTPKQYIRYTQMLDKKGLAICDGVSTEMGLIDWSGYLLFVLGITFVMGVIWRIKIYIHNKK